MSQVAMKKNSGEKPPPLASCDFYAVHRSTLDQERQLVGGERMNERESDTEENCAPVKFKIGAGKLLAPGPTAIFGAVKADRSAGPFKVVGRHQQEPTIAIR